MVDGSASLILPFVADATFVGLGEILLQTWWADPDHVAGKSASNGLALEFE